jgi:F-type H+-transporting ATPase subunit delta
MKISKQARRDAKSLFQTCKVNGLLDDSRARQAVSAVIAQKPRGYVAILHHFQRLVKLDLDRRTARVENAVETPPELMNSIRANLERRYGSGLNISFGINPGLIVYDGSVKARLEALKSSL